MAKLVMDGMELGPAMAALNPRQRDFVLAYVAMPQATGCELARLAGYHEGKRTQASRLLRTPSVIAAIHEVLAKTYRGRGAAVAQDVMLTIAMNANHQHQLKAAMALADRGGFGAMSEQKLTVEHRDMTSDMLIKKIQGLARRLGIDETKVLGAPAVVIAPEETHEHDG